jgi:NAD(P)H-dependent FMN reductase
MFVPVILGTSRLGRRSENVAKFMLGEAKRFGFESELIDTRDYPLTATDNTQDSALAKKLAEKISMADAMVIVSPEYNHGYPGELKIMLDLLYQQYAGKPVGFCGVSAGPLGGARAVEQLRQVAIEFQLIPIRGAMYFPSVQNLFDEKGKIKDAAFEGRAKKFFEELSNCAKQCGKP